MLVMPGENEKLHTRSSEIHTFVLHCGAAQKLLVWRSRTPDFITTYVWAERADRHCTNYSNQLVRSYCAPDDSNSKAPSSVHCEHEAK